MTNNTNLEKIAQTESRENEKGIFSKVRDYMKRDYEQTQEDFSAGFDAAREFGSRGIGKIRCYIERGKPELAMAYIGERVRDMTLEQQRDLLEGATPEHYEMAR